MSLCTAAQVKARISETKTDDDAVIAAIVLSVTAQFEAYCHRPLIVTDDDVTEKYKGTADYLQLKRYPIVSITSIKESFIRDFDAASALVEDTDYILLDEGEKGILQRLYADWCSDPNGIQVIYRGGYTAAGDTPGEGETAIPADLSEAAIEQCIYLYERKGRDIGIASVTFEGGGFTKLETGDLIDSARKILDRRYRKLGGIVL